MSVEMVVLVPTRGRPDNVRRLMTAWWDTHASCDLVFLMDGDDPEVTECESLVAQFESPSVHAIVGEPKRIGPWLNEIAPSMVDAAVKECVIGFMGDDHVPRTPHWDRIMCHALLRMPGIAYANDLFQGPNLPTAVFMNGCIIRELGYMCPPGLQHMYLDNAWKAWGEQGACLTYMPDVVIEHMHPHAGKAEGDATYGEVWPYMSEDEPRWVEYATHELPADVARVKHAVEHAWA